MGSVVTTLAGRPVRLLLSNRCLRAWYGRMETLQWVLATLQEHMGEFHDLGVRRLGVFGSVVQGEASPESDIDILVEFDPGRKSFDNDMDLKFRIEELFSGRRVDLVLEHVLKPAIRPYVERTVRYVA